MADQKQMSAASRRFGGVALLTVVALAVSAGSGMAGPTGAQAGSVIAQKTGAHGRIDLSGRLQMLSQRVAAASCAIEAGVAPALSKQALIEASDEMDRSLDALRHGNPQMNVTGAETDARVLEAINRVTGTWAPIRDAIRDLQAAGDINHALPRVGAWDAAYDSEARLLVSEISARYAKPSELMRPDSVLVELAGRQRMRTQMMLKQACEVWLGGLELQELAATVKIFDRTLSALLHGAPSVGIAKAPTKELTHELTALSADWAEAEPILAGMLDGAEIETAQKAALFLVLNEMLIKSERIQTGFAAYTRGIF